MSILLGGLVIANEDLFKNDEEGDQENNGKFWIVLDLAE